MNIPFVRSNIAKAAAGLALVAGAGLASAAGFQINETSASGLGTAFAGGAAAAEDATTLWCNVAGMSRIGTRQGVVAIHLVRPSLKFRNDASTAATAQALGGEGGDAQGINVVPNLYVVAPIDKDGSVGLGVNAPFGLVTDTTTAGSAASRRSSRASRRSTSIRAWRGSLRTLSRWPRG